MSEKQIIGQTIYLNDPDALIGALAKDRNSMVESFVDEATRFYSLMLIYPSFPVREAMKLCRNPERYKIEVSDKPAGADSGYSVTITEVTQ